MDVTYMTPAKARYQLIGVRDTLLAWRDNAALSLRIAKSDEEELCRNQRDNYQRLAERLTEVIEYL